MEVNCLNLKNRFNIIYCKVKLPLVPDIKYQAFQSGFVKLISGKKQGVNGSRVN